MGCSHYEQLSPREREVLALAAWHRTYKEIAQELRISPGTINNHIHSIVRKMKTNFDDVKRCYVQDLIDNARC